MTAPYGAWDSPITAETVIAAAVGLSEVRVDGDDVWWSEGRPEEGGRVQIVREGVDVLPDGFMARTRVHEYGGGAWTVHAGVCFFANWSDQRLYRLDPGSTEPVVITPEPEAPLADRYADMEVAPDGTWLVCVREHHPADGGEAVNEIIALSCDGSNEPTVLVTGPDFVSSPRLDPTGTRLAWLQWNHPDMPWDETTLHVAPIGAGGLGPPRLVAGAVGALESVFQPQWSPDGALHFVSDRTGWWNLYRAGPINRAEVVPDASAPAVTREGAERSRSGGPEVEPVAGDGSVEAVVAVDGEIGTPQWVFGMSRYAFLDDGTIVAACRRHGRDELLGHDVPFTSIDSVVSDGRRVLFVGASPTAEPAIVRFDPATGEHELLRPPRDLGLDDAWISTPKAIEFPTEPGPDGTARTAHALYYPPTNPEARAASQSGEQAEAPAGEKPPLLVLSHGGPTAAARPMLSLGTQFWTSRGFAVVDVDYGGSTGYGREYRERLKGTWGIVDVQDCVAAARFLADRGDVDPDRLCIRGGSAGGYTTLQALTTTDVFAAGASHYGVADLGALAQDTHKFESRYLDGLVGPWPEAEAVYRERSPIEHTDGLSSPMIILQGSEDEVVPPDQAEMMVAALEAKGLPYAYVLFEGEQHGFRKAENIVAALESELSFYAQVFGFEPAGDIPPVTVANLP